jgi:hypothetical protein
MIIKRRQEVSGLERYISSTRSVQAKRMSQSFAVETGIGWHFDGKPGDWLVLLAGDLWLSMSDEQFRAIFRRVTPEDCVGPCDARKKVANEE